ncbi:methyltransferase-like protein 22 isoform X2 [Artemia franciscana]|uniref:methyltransferase-like protein 22 isoform X2 n=1 Tax=Artemia franciscana TaxID=6661 RepID=UPI0032DBF0F5
MKLALGKFVKPNLPNANKMGESEEHVHMVSSEVNAFTFFPAPDSEEDDREKSVVSRFSYKVPRSTHQKNSMADLTPKVDEDGDLEVVRPNNTGEEKNLYITHSTLTSLELVGQQVWRGALFLADYLLYLGQQIKDEIVLELGAGVGLTSIAAAMVTKKVYATDVDRGEILKMIKSNVEENKEHINGEVIVNELDFFTKEWKESLKQILPEVTTIIAADLVYHNTLTDAFVDTLKDLMTSGKDKQAFIALERRCVFTLEDMETVAPCYDYFRKSLDALVDSTIEGWNMELIEIKENFPQYFCYEKVRELVILKITSRKC